jgi:hypothetical protein
MPPPPDSFTALHTEPAFGGQLGLLLGLPRPASKGSDPRRRRPAAGLPSWPRRAWTELRGKPITGTFRTTRGNFSLWPGWAARQELPAPVDYERSTCVRRKRSAAGFQVNSSSVLEVHFTSKHHEDRESGIKRRFTV